jgi:hypothetical protein
MSAQDNIVISTIATNTRPFCNNDYTNNTIYRHGLPRPIKHYRKSRVKPVHHFTDTRVTSTTLNQIMETPGQVNVVTHKGLYEKINQNTNHALLDQNTSQQDMCMQHNLNFISYWSSMINNGCCSGASQVVDPVKNSLRRVRHKSGLDPSYSSSYSQYLQKRCLAFNQQNFNYTKPSNTNVYKPGAPMTYSNEYVANCSNCTDNDNSKSCRKVIYKPSNYQYAKQGAVSSSLKTLKTTLNTIETGIYLDQFCSK